MTTATLAKWFEIRAAARSTYQTRKSDFGDNPQPRSTGCSWVATASFFLDDVTQNPQITADGGLGIFQLFLGRGLIKNG
ncbi:MAG: hypothetical protein JO189_06500 [Deltaproteobacteria bacterium]|nr:hypothetical protein [Deltaproteobacteria bacterium]